MSTIDVVALADGIPGWCEPVELTWLAEAAAAHHTIVEVGCYQGRSTKAMAATCPGVIYAVDDWKGVPSEQLVAGELEQAFRSNLAEEIESGKVVVVGCGSPEATAVVPPPDMIYIDGDHEFGPVFVDVKAWREVLQPGGLLCGHDCDPGHPGVVEALNALGVEWTVAAGYIWEAKNAA